MQDMGTEQGSKMINRLIEVSIKHRLLVIILMLGVFLGGIFQYNKLPVNAFPDISPIMVPVFAEAHGMAPEEVERLITFPIESAMNGLPDVTTIKSTSAFGMSVIYVYFKDSVDIYFARQIVSERLQSVSASLPEMDEPPSLGPISSGLGQIFIYYLTLDKSVDTGGKDKNTYLREINDWMIKFHLQSVSGVTDILSIGGHVLQYQINIDPYAMLRFNLDIDDVIQAVNENNRNVGAQFLVINSEEHLVRGIGLVQSLDDIRSIHIKSVRGTPIKISDVANVNYGNEIRRGVVTRNGEEEVVSGIVFQLFGENASEVIKRLYKKIPEVQKVLPKGVTLIPYYEQAELIARATGTVKNALLLGVVFVFIVLMAFLGNARSALIVLLALPLCALISVIFMGIIGLSANLMSLGGIAIGIGMLGDGAIVMVENIFRVLSDPLNREKSRLELIREAAVGVGRPILFSITIVIIVFLPIFSLQGVEGKMFSPLAFTISFALLGSIMAALVMAPALAAYILKPNKASREFLFFKVIKSLYESSLRVALRFKKVVISFILLSFIASLLVIPYLGTEFIPTLEEGSIMLGVTMAPSISLDKATETVNKITKRITRYKEVKQAISRIGRPETGSHPHPVNYAEIHIELFPKKLWSNFKDKASLIDSMESVVSQYPGVQLNFSQPIQNAFDELLSGIKSELAIKVFGEDLEKLRDIATKIRNKIDEIEGIADLSVEQSFGQPQIQVRVDRSACSRYGINVSDLLGKVKIAIGGESIDQVYLNNRKFDISLRYKEKYRKNVQAINDLIIRGGNGEFIKLSQLADVKSVTGPIQINREKNMRRWIIQANVRGRDLGGVVSDIKKIIRENIKFPPGYYIEIGGQFENQERAMGKLKFIVPFAIALIFLLLYLTFNSIENALLIILNIPLGLIGGIFGLYLFGEYLSVPASIGFIALFGVAVQNGVVLVSYINRLIADGMEIDKAVIIGAITRLRPVLMTALTTILGLIPLLFSNGIGAEVQRPLAVVVVTGLISSTFLTLFLIPILYKRFASQKR